MTVTEPAPVGTVTRYWKTGIVIGHLSLDGIIDSDPASATPARYAAWAYLAASDAPAHSESGCLAFSDPRAGSAMTAMPGLPFGRQFIVRPVPGACAVIPGWLTSSVIPLEPRQHITIAIATGR
jgi:hypothetical protein